MQQTDRQGFTLIELSIVLVIVGLVVGGILVGQDLIHAATVRAQISQIEQYNQSANTFRGKYEYLPGDIRDPQATNFGFAARGRYPGEGDGNGIIEGDDGDLSSNNCGVEGGSGETVMFWVDLSAARLIDATFNTANPTTRPGSDITASTSPNLSAYYPVAKIGNGNYIFVWSGGINAGTCPGNSNGVNYFQLSAVTAISSGYYGVVVSNANLPVKSAYSIDAKIDDGLPQSGRVTTQYINAAQSYNPVWAGSGGMGGNAYITATPGSSTSCFDNGNAGGAKQQYSLAQNGGAGANCALSFRFQ